MSVAFLILVAITTRYAKDVSPHIEKNQSEDSVQELGPIGHCQASLK